MAARVHTELYRNDAGHEVWRYSLDGVVLGEDIASDDDLTWLLLHDSRLRGGAVAPSLPAT